MTGPATDVAEELDSGSEDIVEESTTPEQKLKGSTKVRKTSPRFEHFATAAAEDPVTMEEAVESLAKEQWQK